jgi:hypothetical protein
MCTTTRWISMLSPLKCLLAKYKSLVVKMYMDAPKSKLAWNNLDLLYDLELVIGMPCILPMLEVVHTLKVGCFYLWVLWCSFHHYGSFANVYVHVHLVDQIAMLETVKVACLKATSNLCSKLFCRFFNEEVMAALGMVYP